MLQSSSTAGVRVPSIMDLVGGLYDAAQDDALWPEQARRTAVFFGAPSTTLRVSDLQSGKHQLLGLTANMILPPEKVEWANYWRSRDLWVRRASTVWLGQAVTTQDLISDADFSLSAFYQEFCRHLGIFYVVGGVIPLDGAEHAVFGVHRPGGARPFDRRDKRFANVFARHYRSALMVRRQIGEAYRQAHAGMAALACIDAGALVVRGNAEVLYTNPCAEAILRGGGVLGVERGRLHASDPAMDGRIAALVAGAAQVASGRNGSAGGALAVARAGRMPLTLLVAPFRAARAGAGANEPAAIVFVRDPEAPVQGSQVLQQLFGLTATEAALALDLARGRSIESIVAAWGVSPNTARTHLKRVFAKTGTTRQAQLVVLILRSVATMTAQSRAAQMSSGESIRP